MMRRFLLSLVAALTLVLPARAEITTEARFDVYFSGIRAGIVVFKGITTDTQYSVAGRLQSTGLLRLVADLRYDAVSVGRIAGDTFVPVRYTESADTGQRQSDAEMEYRRGVPQVKAYSPPREPKPFDLDPATQGGTLDPAAAVFFLLRDAPEAEACRGAVPVFDGQRRSSLTVDNPRRQGDQLICDGEYRRVAGFSPAELGEKAQFPFTVTYRENGDGLMQVDEVRIDTLYGVARLDRR